MCPALASFSQFRVCLIVLSKMLRATFNWALKVKWDYNGFAELRFVIGPDNTRHSLNQSDAKLKPRTRFPALLKIFSFLLIGRCDFSVLVSRHAIEKRSINFSFQDFKD